MSSESTRIISLILVGLFPVLEILCYVLLCRNRNDLALRKRYMSVVLFASIAGWLSFCNVLFSATGRGGNCGSFYVLSILIPPIASGSHLVRSIKLKAKLERSSMLLKEERVQTSSKQSRRRGSRSHSERSTVEMNADADANDGTETAVVVSSPPRTGSVYAAGREKIEKSKAQTQSNLRWIKWCLLYFPTLFLLFITLSEAPLPDGLSASSTGLLRSSDYSKCLEGETVYLLYVCPALALFVSLLALGINTVIRRSADELGIRSEITRDAMILLLSYSSMIIARLAGRGDLHPIIEIIQQFMLSVSMKLLPCFQSKAGTLITCSCRRKKGNNRLPNSTVPGYARPLPNAGNRGSALRRISARNLDSSDIDRRREVTMSLDAGLCILLSTQEGIDSFSEHCVREFSYENIRFWSSVNDFHAEVDLTCLETGGGSGQEDGDGEDGYDDGGDNDGCENDRLSEAELLEYAQEIYDMYINTEGEMQINIPSSISDEIKATLAKGSVRRNLFDKAQKEVFTLMSRDSYQRYLAVKRKSAMLQKSRSTRRNRVSAVAS